MDRLTRNEQYKYYHRGLSAGRRNAWPAFHPPRPPDELVAKLIDAALNLRNAVDGQLAMLGDDDEWQTTLGNPMDDVTAALMAITKWTTIQQPTSEE